MRTVVYLDEKTVKSIIAKHFEVDPSKVSIEISSRCVGYFQDEHLEPYFKHIEVETFNDEI